MVNRFDDLVEEGHPAHDALLKIFIKKIKRNKKKDAGKILASCTLRCMHYAKAVQHTRDARATVSQTYSLVLRQDTLVDFQMDSTRPESHGCVCTGDTYRLLHI